MSKIYHANGIYDLDKVVAITKHPDVTKADGASAVLHFHGHSLVTDLSYSDAVKQWDDGGELGAVDEDSFDTGTGTDATTGKDA